ncbi:MAG: hydrogenase formation protein HypD [Nitrososphaerota archaeon]|nr:hydrogenase formation protein HypD [Candidatus Bathyarchaeota archaeon]MDW8048744.1 hydrogenase formation protein HypD [Nitrososphaerota archaeon]
MTLTFGYRDPSFVRQLSERLRELAPKDEIIKICHVCGTHEWVITHFGLRALLPPTVEVIAGPGCPVCIVPSSEIDEAIKISLEGVGILTFGDVVRVPGSELSLLDAKARGAEVRVVYSLSDAIKIAKKDPDKQFVFLAVGFETTAPSTAVEILGKPPKNFSFLISHRLIPPAMKLLAETKDLMLNGFIAPGHVSTVIGLKPYQIFPEQYGIPTVIAGFEPTDILIAIFMILRQLSEGESRLENEYTRAVRYEGNIKAQNVMRKVFNIENGKWRGLGVIPSSKFSLKGEYENFDAHIKYGMKIEEGADLRPGCKCNLVIVGRIKPIECPLFMKSCTPQNPMGACMVSIEGTCRIWAEAGINISRQTTENR